MGNVDYSSLVNKTGISGFNNLGDIINKVVPILFYAAGLILFLFLIYGGIQFMTSRGDPKAMQSAQARITNALIGFIVIFAAYWIVQIVAKILGLNSILNMFI